MNVRVRFAPSPTGYMHVGSARTALFNWLYARHVGGTFVLRIEDTDAERGREEWVEGIMTTLQWLGLVPDEGPYRQSERAGAYSAAIDTLWSAGALYACDCKPEEVQIRTKGNAIPGYDAHCRERGLERAPGRALRFRTPTSGATIVYDLIRGPVSFPHDAMEDFVCMKGNGQALFVMANVVDDRDMDITHVVRGEDLLPTTPKGVLIWGALDAAEGTKELPFYAHLPMLVNEQRKKLSKRHDDVSVESYRDQGYLPEAFVNYLTLLGWSPPGEEEKVPVQSVIDAFTLEDVHHSSAFFDVKKLSNLNATYLRELPLDEFIAQCRPFLAPTDWHPADAAITWAADQFNPDVFARIAPLVQERVNRLCEVAPMVEFLFVADPIIDEDSWIKSVSRDDEAKVILEHALALYGEPSCSWDTANLHAVTATLGESFGRALGKVQAPIRVAVTGRRVGPPLFESLEILGRGEVCRRIGLAIDRIG